MKKTLLLAGIFLLLLLQACRKNDPAIDQLQNGPISEAQTFFNQTIRDAAPIVKDGQLRNPRTTTPKQVNWDLATTIRFHGQAAVVAPVQYTHDFFLKTGIGSDYFYQLNNLSKLLLYHDSAGKWQAELLTFLPDTAFVAKGGRGRFTGMVLAEDWWGTPVKTLQITPTSELRVVRKSNKSALDIGLPKSTVPSAFVQACHYLVGYNYPADDPDNGYSWVEFQGCDLEYVPDNNDLGGSGYSAAAGDGGGNISSPRKITVFRPTNIIKDISTYFGCFSNVPGATFKVQVCVEQPVPGERTPWRLMLSTGSSSGDNPFYVGHAFLAFTESVPGDYGPTIITRNIGFYPSVDVTPWSDPVQGVLNNDENTYFNIGAAYGVTGAMFFNMLGYAAQGNNQGFNYQVNTNNCTNFVLNTLSTGHIYLPWTIGSWIGGLGVNPGDLGEDIRGTNFAGMTRVPAFDVHDNEGQCN